MGYIYWPTLDTKISRHIKSLCYRVGEFHYKLINLTFHIPGLRKFDRGLKMTFQFGTFCGVAVELNLWHLFCLMELPKRKIGSLVLSLRIRRGRFVMGEWVYWNKFCTTSGANNVAIPWNQENQTLTWCRNWVEPLNIYANWNPSSCLKLSKPLI